MQKSQVGISHEKMADFEVTMEDYRMFLGEC